jgi:hypothetical protein
MFGGMIEHSSIAESSEEEAKKTIYDSNIGLQYQRVECGQAMTVVQVNQSPFLLICGYNSSHAWGLPQLFVNDKPVYF